MRPRAVRACTLEGSRLGFWNWNAVTDEFHMSSEYKAMFGYIEEEMDGTLSNLERFIYPDDIDNYYASSNAHLKGETPFYESEYGRCVKTARTSGS